MASSSPAVTLYVVPHCPLCDRARAQLAARGVLYDEQDVKNSFSALRSMYELTHQKFVPVVQFGAKAVIRPSDAELDALLESADQQ